MINSRRLLPFLFAISCAMFLCSCKKADPVDAYNKENYRVAHAWRLSNERFSNGKEAISTEQLGLWAKESLLFEPQMRAIVPPQGWENYHRVFIDMMHAESEGLNAAYRFELKNELGNRDAALIKLGDEMVVLQQRLVDETKKLGFRASSLQSQADASRNYWQTVRTSAESTAPSR